MSFRDEEEKKPRKSKKDRFSNAIRNNLSEQAQDTFASAGYHPPKGNSDNNEEPQDKKYLSGQKGSSQRHGMESNRKELRKIDPKALQAADFEYRDNSGRKKFLLAALGLLLFIFISYVLFLGEGRQPMLYLSDMPINREQLASLPVSHLSFAPYRQIHLYFDAAGTIGHDRLYIKTAKVFRDGNGKITGEEAYWEDEVPVKAEWRFFRTLFQEDFFAPGQEYKVMIQDSGGKVLAQQYLTIQ